jgi:peptide/nickel transport system permease protein
VTALVSGLVLVAITIATLVAPAIARYDPNEQQLRQRLRPPAWLAGGAADHPLGTDPLGRDVLTRLLYGGRVTLLVSLSAVCISGILGVLVGLLAGFFRGPIDEALVRLIDMQLAIPVLLLAVTLIAVFDVSLRSLVLALGSAGWVVYGRVIRSQVLSLRQREFIEAARALGSGDWRIIGRHLLPNVANTCFVLATLEMANMMIIESSLSFLGLGVRPPDVSWGAMIADGRDYITSAWWVVVFPGLTISAVILSVNVLGDVLRDRLDPELAA